MCTGVRFTSTDGAMYLGRNLDWSTPFGEHIVITPKGYPLAKAFPEGQQPSLRGMQLSAWE